MKIVIDVDLKTRQSTSRELSAVEVAELPSGPSEAVLRRQQIENDLRDLDMQSMRSIRASVAALKNGRLVPAFDANKLESIESDAVTLRAELATLA